MSTSTVTQVADIPEWQKRFLTTASPEQTGILDEAMRIYQQYTGAGRPALPQYDVARRADVPLISEATRLAASGVGSYLPMLQTGAYTVGEGVGGLQQAMQTMQAGYDPLASATQLTGRAISGAQPYQTAAYEAMAGAIPRTQELSQLGLDYATLGRGDLFTAAQQLAQAGARGELAGAAGVQGITEAATAGNLAAQQAAQNILSQVPAGQQALVGGAGTVQQAAQAAQQFTGAGATGLGDLATRSAELGLGALQTLPQFGQRLEGQGQTTAQNILAAAGMAQPGTRASQLQLAQAQNRLAGLEAATRTGTGSIQDIAARQLAGATGDIQSAAAGAVPGITGAAGYGLTAAQQGIGALAGTGGRFTADQIAPFMNQYEDAAVQQALSDIARQGQLQQQAAGAQAVGAGAFGGSRQGVLEAEIARNVLEQQGRTAAGMRQAGYESAAQRAQAAYEAAMGRQQQAAALTGQLGQAGAGTAMQGAQAAGQMGMAAGQAAAQNAAQLAQLGLSAEQIAAQTGLSVEQARMAASQTGAQLGMAQAGQAMQGAQAAGQAAMQGTQAGAATAQAATQMGLAGLGQAGQQTAQAAQTGLAGAQLGMQAGQAAGAMGAQASQMGQQAAQAAGMMGLAGAQMGMQGSQAAAQTGMAGSQMAGSMAGQAGQIMGQGAQLGMQGAQMGMAGAQQQAQLGQGIGALGTAYGQLGLQGAGQMGTIAGQYGALGQGMGALGQGLGSLGMQQAQLGEAQQGLNLNDVNTLLSLGTQEQAQRQTELDALYRNQMAAYQQPFQQLGFYSDVFQGMPTAQMTQTQTVQPPPSMLSQLGGLATGLYGMYRATQ